MSYNDVLDQYNDCFSKVNFYKNILNVYRNHGQFMLVVDQSNKIFIVEIRYEEKYYPNSKITWVSYKDFIRYNSFGVCETDEYKRIVKIIDWCSGTTKPLHDLIDRLKENGNIFDGEVYGSWELFIQRYIVR